MRKRMLPVLPLVLVLVLTLPLCGCERESLTDPVLFCALYNRIAQQPIVEADAFLRGGNEVLLFAGDALIRLRMNEDGAIHTAVVTGEASDGTAQTAADAFAVLAQPFEERVPQTVRAQCAEPDLSVQTAQTKRFFYAVYRDGETVTAVQVNRLLSSIPVLPSLRPSEAD